MNFFGLRSAPPSYKQGARRDTIAVQTESLQYAFRRLRINKLTAISKTGELQWIEEFDLSNTKDDVRYNLEALKQELLHDEYRILVDYLKNKFRSFCLLTEPTTAVLRDYKDRRVSKYRFGCLPESGITVEGICNILTASDIYTEHGLSTKVRYKHALAAVEKHVKTDNVYQAVELSADEHAAIIRSFLTRIAFEVQLWRIYRELVRKNTKESDREHTRLDHNSIGKLDHTSIERSTSNTSSNSGFPTKNESFTKLGPSSKLDSSVRLSPQKSTSRPGSPELPRVARPGSPESPTKLRSRPGSPERKLLSKPSISRLKLDELYNPVAAPVRRVDERLDASDASDVDHEVLTKCKAAIQERLRKEKELLKRE